VAVSVSTVLGASPATATPDATSGYDISMSVSLTGQGNPVVGQTISFATGGQTCTGSTNATGTASCQVSGVGGPPSSYSATFGGDGAFAATSTSGSVDS
jgi:hypothetical protein